MINIYFIGNSDSIVSNIFLFYLKKFILQQNDIRLKKIIDTNLIHDSKKVFIKDYIKLILYFFFNKKYFYIFKHYLNNKKKFFCINQNNKKKLYIEYNKNQKFKKSKKITNVLISVGCNKILSKEFLKSFQFSINYHHAELPKYRGVNSNSLSLLNNNKYSGFCFHFIADEIDNGFVFFKKKIKIRQIILNNIFYDILKIKIMSRSIYLILKKMMNNKMRKSFKSIIKKKYYDKNYLRNFFNNPTKFDFNEIEKFINVFGEIEINNIKITKIKKDTNGIKIKNGYLKILQVNYLPIFLYKLIKLFNSSVK